MNQYAFFFDQSRCYDCKACTLACKNWNGLEVGPTKWLRVFEWEEGSFPETRLKALFVPCYHCEKPSCVPACPSGALFKEDKYGAVLVDDLLCTGCRSCWDACDYGAPQHSFVDGQKMSKCTMCIDRLETGLLPICVQSCPLRALDFGPLDEMIAKYGDLRSLDGMPDSTKSLPSIVFKPQAKRKDFVAYNSKEARRLLGKRGPLPELYKGEGKGEVVAEGTVGRSVLNLKPSSVEELMYATRNDEG